MIFEFWIIFLESKINISIRKIIDWVLNLFALVLSIINHFYE